MIQERSQGPDIALGLRCLLPVKSIPEMDAPTLVSGLKGGGSVISSAVGTCLGSGPPGAGVGSSVFLMWTPGTWGEPMLMDGHLFSLSVGWLVGRCEEWPLSGDTDERGWTELYSGKRGKARAGGSASRIIVDRGATDPGGGKRVLGGRKPAWQQPVGGRPWISLDPRCPGLSGPGEPLYYGCWTA